MILRNLTINIFDIIYFLQFIFRNGENRISLKYKAIEFNEINNISNNNFSFAIFKVSRAIDRYNSGKINLAAGDRLPIRHEM